jgi:hypothetical protein
MIMVGGTRVQSVTVNGTGISTVFVNGVQVFGMAQLGQLPGAALGNNGLSGGTRVFRFINTAYDDTTILPLRVTLRIQFAYGGANTTIDVFGYGDPRFTPGYPFTLNGVTLYAAFNYDADGIWVGVYSDTSKGLNFTMNQNTVINGLTASLVSATAEVSLN